MLFQRGTVPSEKLLFAYVETCSCRYALYVYIFKCTF